MLCPAKINLFLNIIGKSDGMHDMHMINQTVDLYDTLEISANGTIFDHFECNNSKIDTNDNSVLKALKIMRHLFDIRSGFDIKLTKRIPLESGLGGESTDAAGLILGINALFKLNLDMETLIKIGLMIRKDRNIQNILNSAYLQIVGNAPKAGKQLDLSSFVDVGNDPNLPSFKEQFTKALVIGAVKNFFTDTSYKKEYNDFFNYSITSTCYSYFRYIIRYYKKSIKGSKHC